MDNRKLGRETLKFPPDLNDLPQCAKIETHDAGTQFWDDLYETVSLQFLKDFPKWRSSNPVRLRQLLFVELKARAQVIRDDPVAEFLIDLFFPGH